MKFYPFFQILSFGSCNEIFSPSIIMMTLETATSAIGGLGKDFISVICSFFILSIACSALSNAGFPSANLSSASFFNFSASYAAAFVFASSSFAIFYSFSAMALSFPTFSIRSSVYFFFSYTSAIFISSYSYNPLTFPSVSAKI